VNAKREKICVQWTEIQSVGRRRLVFILGGTVLYVTVPKTIFGSVHKYRILKAR